MTHQYQEPQNVPQEVTRTRVRIDPARLWLTGIMTGVVAAVLDVVVYLFAREVFDVPLAVTSPQTGDLVALSVWMVILACIVPAILATALLHLLLRFVPNPLAFFALICLGLLLVSLIAPLTLDVASSVKVTLVVMHLVAGITIIGLLGGSVDRFYERNVPASR